MSPLELLRRLTPRQLMTLILVGESRVCLESTFEYVGTGVNGHRVVCTASVYELDELALVSLHSPGNVTTSTLGDEVLAENIRLALIIDPVRDGRTAP